MRIIKTIFSAIVVVFISLFMFGFEDAYASEVEFSLFSNDLFDEYAEQHLADALELFDEEFQQDNAVERNRIDDIILLPPHIIYHIEEEQDAIYYYHAYDKKSDKIIFIMPVIQIEDALYYEVKGCTDSTYNIISQDYDDYIFYFIGNKLFAENALHTIDFNLGKEILFLRL